MDFYQIKRAHVLLFAVIMVLAVLLLMNSQQCKLNPSKDYVPFPKEIHQERVQRYKTVRNLGRGNVKKLAFRKKEFNGTINKTSQIRTEKCVKRLPQAIVVGIQKCGTTALLKFLGSHPQIAAYDHEAQYFFGKNFETHSIDWYRKLMPCSYSNQITMEKSPPYFYRREAAINIKEMNPKTKIIIIVKDPITRAVSMYAMLKEYNKVGGRSFDNFVTMKDDKTINASSRFIEFSHYPKHMKAWLDYFKREQILLIDGDNMEQNPSKELKKVENFLGIRNYFKPEMFAYNPTKMNFCLNIGSTELDCLSEKKGRKHPEIDIDVINSLKKYFKPLNEKFFRMTGTTFNWSY